LAAGLFALDQSFRRGALKDEFEAACSEFLQHPLTIEKFEGLKLPSFVIVARNVILLDKDQTPMVDCPQVSLEISPRSLLQFKIVIEKIIFSNPTIYFRTAAGKRLNISEMVADIEKSPAPPPRKHFALQFRQFVIENGPPQFPWAPQI
jgi:uncharacterized protein involved in outer membrane biogenesis